MFVGSIAFQSQKKNSASPWPGVWEDTRLNVVLTLTLIQTRTKLQTIRNWATMPWAEILGLLIRQFFLYR